jgi:hypothetical protein
LAALPPVKLGDREGVDAGHDALLDHEHPVTPAIDGDAAARPVDGDALVDVQRVAQGDGPAL